METAGRVQILPVTPGQVLTVRSWNKPGIEAQFESVLVFRQRANLRGPVVWL